jgi:glycosyltransferase involved in cell wall biosynthesis
MAMHVFIPVFFNAPLGGLQSHVQAQVKALLRNSHTCTIMCKPGPFADSIKQLNVKVLEHDFQSTPQGIDLAMSAGPYDLVHAHPFGSRVIGLEVSRLYNIPFILTFHGMYDDYLAEYSKELRLLITVSNAIRDKVIKDQTVPPERIAVIPNGVDTDTFTPTHLSWSQVAEQLPALKQSDICGADRRVLFVSRMDVDKQFILDVLLETWQEILDTKTFDFKWIVAGDGTQREKLEEVARKINQKANQQLVSFVGWQEEATLAKLYNTVDLCIAPGRSTLDSMACGTPVIAVGSKKYVGLIDNNQFLSGMYGNFGGSGQKHKSYQSGLMFKQITEIIHDDHKLEKLGTLSKEIVQTFYAQARLDEKLLGFYKAFTSAAAPRDTKQQLTDITRDEYSFRQLSSHWKFHKLETESEQQELSVTDQDALAVSYQLDQDNKFYLVSDSLDFAKPPLDTQLWQIEPDSLYKLSVELKTKKGDPNVQLWLIEYDQQNRLGHTQIPMTNGISHLWHRTSKTAKSFKIAFRFAEKGSLILAPIKLHCYDLKTDMSFSAKSR